MKLKEAINNLGSEAAMGLAKQIADREGIEWDGAQYVFHIISHDLERVPNNIGGKNDSEQDVIKKWLFKYKNGYEGRASKRISNPPGTIADPIIEKIIGSRITNLKAVDLNKITFAHRLGMSAENILGLILEEYLSEKLKSKNWYCAWGETVKSVDFVNKDGRLLQIKNRSNSENSSSVSVRDGTHIEKWYRVKADRVMYMWSELNEICGTTNLSEDSFVEFTKNLIQFNPYCLAVEQENPWLGD